MYTATRIYDFSYGHTVTGHCGKCKHLHGHNGRIEWTITTDVLDEIGVTLDFGVMKKLLDAWVEENWDHKFLIWAQDDRADTMFQLNPEGVVFLSFNPTAENLANHLLAVVGPKVLQGTNAKLVNVKFYETRKCSVDVGIY